MTAQTTPLRIGILGAANIARLFVAGVRGSQRVDVVAVAARDPARAQAFAAETGVPNVHATYVSLLTDPDIDAIYNPLPNSLHAEWSIRALDAGKHVLCEKPLATSAHDARAMFAAAHRNGLCLVEAYPYRAQPQTLRLRELLRDGAIGHVQTIHASFGFPLADARNIRLDPQLAGGALMDAGCYPVSFVRTVAGECPVRVHAMARWSDSGVDRTLVASLDFASGLLAQVSCSFATARHRHAFIAGDEGSIAASYYNDTSATFPPVLDVKRGRGWDAARTIVETASTNGFLAEADAFAALVADGPAGWQGTTEQESVDIARTLDALAESARTGGAVDVGA